jgi:hypothetical protein
MKTEKVHKKCTHATDVQINDTSWVRGVSSSKASGFEEAAGKEHT